VDRLACVDVAAFPLQLLLCDHPDWVAQPVVVVEDDRPQAPVLFTNVHARQLGVRIGQRYATALTLARTLHAGVVSRTDIDRGVQRITDRLHRYSPHIEPSPDMPGVFWIDASGLRHLYPSLHVWADLIRVDLQQEGLTASVAVGFTRFGAYTLAISHRGTVMCTDEADERTRVDRVPLAWLNLDPGVRDRLLALGIDTIGDFLRLPGHGIRTRFGPEAEAIYRLAAGTRWSPLVPVAAPIRYQRFVEFDVPESSVDRLLFVIKRHLDALAAAVSRRGEAIVEVELLMKLGDRTTRAESVTPAAATLDVTQLLALLRLRLDMLSLSSGIATLRVSAKTCASASDQRGLLPEQTRRNADAANRALARIRAECGDQSVVRASIRDAHLPSARFTWEPMTHVPTHASPRVVTMRPLVRRILAKARLVPDDGQISRSARGALLKGQEIEQNCSTRGGLAVHRLPVAKSASVLQAASDRAEAENAAPQLQGPYVLSGGWWGGSVRRDYYFVRAASGELWWIYFDHRRHQFYLQGKVE
jgi:protein ImuB